MTEWISIEITALMAEWAEIEISVLLLAWLSAFIAWLVAILGRTQIVNLYKRTRFKILQSFTLLRQKHQRSIAPRDGLTFGALKELRKKRQRNGVRKGFDRVLTYNQIWRIAKRLNDQRLFGALALPPKQVLDWQTLKDFSEVARFTGDHQGYEQAVCSFDADLELLSYQRATAYAFVGSGLGSGTLNAYRKLVQNDISYFEKVYLNESRDLIHLLWFEENYRSLLDQSIIRAPQVLKVHKGRYATAVYFEFLNEPIDNCRRMPERAIEVALSLYRQPLKHNAGLPEYILSFETLDVYQSCFKLTQKWIIQSGVGSVQQLNDWEAKVKTLQRQLSHGDLHGKNMAEPNIVIDWDRAGFYPLGFDIAYALSNTYRFVSIESLYAYLAHHCKEIIAAEAWSDFLFACSYFCLLFYMRKRHDKVFDEQLKALYIACFEASDIESKPVVESLGS